MSEWVKIGDRCFNMDTIERVKRQDYSGLPFVYLGMIHGEDIELSGAEADAFWHYLTKTRQGTYVIPVADADDES